MEAPRIETPAPHIDLERVQRDLYRLAEFGGRGEGHGIWRQGFTEEDWAARQWMLAQFEANGLEARIDGAGNVCGRLGDADAPAVVIASHLDTVPAGGLFDGALGVVAGLECVRVMREHGIEAGAPIEIIGTAEEEGRFGGMLGAQALSGTLTPQWLESARDPGGERLVDAMARVGLDPHDALKARREPGSIKAFIELHIEQGPVLDTIGKPIGVVEGISGVFKWLVKLIGKADHAGTAPMDMRSDAFMGLADFAHQIRRIIAEDGTGRTRLTIGRVDLKPGYPHTIPGEADFTLVGRDMSEEVMREVANSCRKALSAIAREHRLKFEYDEMSWLAPAAMSPEVIDVVRRQAEAQGLDYEVMPSGAGHDAQFFTEIAPAGMIFIPSVGGVSHAPDEWTHWSDVERGCNVLLGSVLELASA